MMVSILQEKKGAFTEAKELFFAQESTHNIDPNVALGEQKLGKKHKTTHPTEDYATPEGPLLDGSGGPNQIITPRPQYNVVSLPLVTEVYIWPKCVCGARQGAKSHSLTPLWREVYKGQGLTPITIYDVVSHTSVRRYIWPNVLRRASGQKHS